MTKRKRSATSGELIDSWANIYRHILNNTSDIERLINNHAKLSVFGHDLRASKERAEMLVSAFMRKTEHQQREELKRLELRAGMGF